MEDKFIQEFLKTGLFDIGDSDDRLKWLQESVAALQVKFEEDYSLLPNYILVALDPNISDTEPIMIATETTITTYWKALRGKYTEMPRNIIRGVILNALNIVGRADPLAARIIFLTAINFYPYAKLNKEKSLVEELLTALGKISEANAIDEWSLVEEEPVLKLAPLKITDVKFVAIELDKAQLEADMKVAVQDTTQGYGPQHGGSSAWGVSFANKSSEGISKAFRTALSEFNKAVNPSMFETPINNFFKEFKKSLDANLKSSFSSLLAVERRSKLLWWKETLYSPSLKKSYRGVDKNLLPIIMSADLNDQVPKITPISVDYLLRDTLFLLNNKQDEAISFSEYLAEISKEDRKNILMTYFEIVPEKEGRISVTDFISLVVNDRINVSNFKQRTGIDPAEHITFGELAVVVLHDVLTERLITQ